MSAAITQRGPLRVAIVGAGPAGLYAAADLLGRDPAASVDMFERLPVPGGLARYGVAPDHAERRQVIGHYGRLAEASGRFRLHGNFEIGRHLAHSELCRHFHAVVYTTGAAGDRRLDIPGEDLPGSHSATEFVAWYNGHPDFADRQFALDTERAVVIGNGNVALDIARMLLSSAQPLGTTDIADHALATLAGSRVREVIVLGRRGPGQAAFTVPELLELQGRDDLDIVVDCPRELLRADIVGAHPLRMQLLRELAERTERGRAKRLVLRFLTSPVTIVGDDRVKAVSVSRNRLIVEAAGMVRAEPTDHQEELSTGLILRSIGYRATAPASLPFDPAAGTVPNLHGRVTNCADGSPLVGVYVAGWLKRGPSGFIGTNKQCAQQTIAALLDDAAAGRLAEPGLSQRELAALLTDRQPAQVDYAGWRRIDRTECAMGANLGRPRRRLVHWDGLLKAAV